MPGAGAVLVVLLTTLLHVLACSHGPAAAPDMRADVPLQVSASTCGRQFADEQQEAAAGQTTPAHDHGAHCCGLDDPALQPPRDPGPTGPPVPAALPAEPPDNHRTLQPLALPPPRTQHTASSPGHTRARLGVWRT